MVGFAWCLADNARLRRQLRLANEEITAQRAWIRNRLGIAVLLATWPGPAQARQAVPESPAQAVVRCEADARTLPRHIAKKTRYLWVPAFDAAALADLEIAVRFWINSLSRAPDLVPPRKVGERLWAIILDDYDWHFEQWELLADVEPYFHLRIEVPTEYETVKEKRTWRHSEHPGGKDKKGDFYPDGLEYEIEIKRPKPGSHKTATATAPWLPVECMSNLVRLTQSQAPVVRFDWFLVNTSRQITLTQRPTKIGYFNWLRLKDRNDFFNLSGVDPELSKKLGVDYRAALLDSGVSQGGRQIQVFGGVCGKLWLTLDSFDKTGKGNPVENLKDGTFVHDAEEGFGPLPNGLFAYWQGDANGKLQNTVPDGVSGDDSALNIGRDLKISPIGCVRCHIESLRPISDNIRKNVRGAVQETIADYQEFLLFRRRYFSNLEQQRQEGIRVYTMAITSTNCCGPTATPAKIAKAVGEAYGRFAAVKVTAAAAALELGMTPATFTAGLKRYAAPAEQGGLGQRLPTTLAPFIADPPGDLDRSNWEEFLPVVATALFPAGGGR